MNGSSKKQSKAQVPGKIQLIRGTQVRDDQVRITQGVGSSKQSLVYAQQLDQPTTYGQKRQPTQARKHLDSANEDSKGLINAPTSLTNLAQLSGISLTPVGGNYTSCRQQSSSNGSEGGQKISIDNSNHRPRITVTTNIWQQKQAEHDGQSYSRNISNHQETSHSIDALPSMQLPDRNVIKSRIDVGQISPNLQKSAINSGSNITQSSSATKKSRSQVKPIGMNLSTVLGNDVQLLPISGSIRPNSNRIGNTQILDRSNFISHTSGTVSPLQSTQEFCMKSESDSMSLIKLMAILNNPALTITPVTAPNMQTISRGERIEGKYSQNASVNSSRSVGHYNIYEEQPHTKAPGKNPTSKVRVPKSSANLQLIANNLPEFDQTRPSPLTSKGVSNDMRGVNNLRDISSSNHNRLSMNAKFPSNISIPMIDEHDITKSVDESSKDIVESLENSIKKFDMRNELGHELVLPDYLIEKTETNTTSLEPDYLLDSSKNRPMILNKATKFFDTSYEVFAVKSREKVQKEPLRSTMKRIFIPRLNRSQNQGTNRSGEILSGLKIEEKKIELTLSERHLILEKLDEIADSVASQRTISNDPDDIFVNKSKRVMSRIDSEIERMKRRRFEKISRRISPRDSGPEVDSNESDDDNGDVANEGSINVVESTVVPIQLPLEEEVSNEKRSFLKGIGLFSRNEKNKIQLERSENRMKNLSLSLHQTAGEVHSDIVNFVGAILKTGGTNVEFRTDTDIKRNELPLIEGLNRNTSRIKMNFMNSLGLEKRSRRTTLYRVRQQEVSANHSNPTPIDLNNKPRIQGGSIAKQGAQNLPSSSTPDPEKRIGNKLVLNSNSDLWRAIKLAQMSCRDAIKSPDKVDYMKSLGLLAS